MSRYDQLEVKNMHLPHVANVTDVQIADSGKREDVDDRLRRVTVIKSKGEPVVLSDPPL